MNKARVVIIKYCTVCAMKLLAAVISTEFNIGWLLPCEGHRDTQHNDTQYIDNQCNDIQHNDNQHNDNQPNDIQHNDKKTWQSALQHSA